MEVLTEEGSDGVSGVVRREMVEWCGVMVEWCGVEGSDGGVE